MKGKLTAGVWAWNYWYINYENADFRFQAQFVYIWEQRIEISQIWFAKYPLCESWVAIDRESATLRPGKTSAAKDTE